MGSQRWRIGLWQRLISLLVLVGLLAPCAYAEKGDEEEANGPLRLSLKDCIQRALADHPSVQEVQWDVAIRRSDLQQAEAGYQPTAEFVNLAGVVNDAKGSLGGLRKDGSPNFKQFGGLSHLGPFTRLEGQIVYPLFTWGKLPNGVKAASKGLEQEIVNVEQKKAEAVREVKEFYYTLLYTRQVQELLNDVREGFQKAVKTADERLKEGKVTQLDVLNLRIGYIGVAKEVEKLRNGIELTRAALLRAMGLSQTTAFEIADTALTPQPAHLKDLDFYVQRLFANRPEWRKLRLGIQAKEAELQVASSDYFPTFFLSVPVRYAYAPGRSRQTNPWADDNFNFGSAGPVVGLHWSLSFGETAAKVARSRAELMKLRSQEKTAAASFPVEVKEAYLNVKEAEERMTITADGRKAGRALVTLAAANFELGIGEPQDVFLGLGNYTRATNDYYEAVRDYNIALAKLSLVVGEEVSELQY
ncbi:MAG: TolC family protein [Deltaproteobacteria bacterium]|nr:TolC family protein [Deltaproteobacteria bacterium]